MRGTGNVGNVERIQCVLLHLAAGILWNESGRPKRVPDRGRVFTLVHELRRLELTNALLASESLRGDTSLECMIVKSNAHDVCHPSHDRDFRTLCFFLSSVLTGRGTGCLGIFDFGRGTNGYDVSVRLFSNSSDDNGSVYIDLIAHRHHMRWGKLVDDTRPKYLVGWELSFSSVVLYPVVSWASFVQNPAETDTIAPTPCVYCKKKMKILCYKQKANAEEDVEIRSALKVKRGGLAQLTYWLYPRPCHGYRERNRPWNLAGALYHHHPLL